MRLAGTLEDQLDLAMLYSAKGKSKRDFFGPEFELMGQIARALGAPRLADELEQALAETAAATRPSVLQSERRSSYTLASASFRPRARFELGGRLRRLLGRR